MLDKELNKQEKMKAIEDARELLKRAIGLLELAFTSETDKQLYVLDKLKIVAGMKHDYRHLSLDYIKHKISEEEEVS